MIPFTCRIAAIFISFITLCYAQIDADSLVGTWTTKSKAVITGPGFYNPVEEKFTEPKHPGIAYSFSKDGYYETAHYRALPNPQRPSCPSAVLQWQHGKYALESNGSIILKPFAVDGRQVLSRPCASDNSVYTRYSQPELMERFEVLTDGFHNVKRLNLYEFDGTPYPPMYLAYSPPEMLPTSTLNPTATSIGSESKQTGKSQVKRSANSDVEDDSEPSQQFEPWNKNAIRTPSEPLNVDRWWWLGIGLTAVGTMLYMYPSS